MDRERHPVDLRAGVVRIGELSVWRDTCLRSTGFPTRMLLDLAAREAVPLIDAGAPADAIAAAFTADARRTGELLRDLVRAPLFREAVLWQNRSAVTGAMAALLKRPAGATDSKTREYERLVASYLQRYCAKNETIGFFGPIGWATFDDAAPRSRLVPGKGLLAQRAVYFEHWAIDTLAAKLSEDRALRASLPPRWMPTIRLDGDRLHYPIDRVATIDAATERLLRACDGVRPASAIADELVAAPELGLATRDQVYDLIDELVESRILLWRLEIPTCGFHHEQVLRSRLAGVEPGPARSAAETALDELETARDGVARAAGDPVALDTAMQALDATFLQLTGTEAQRSAGQLYAGRRIFFEDCVRDVELVLGRDVLERIAEPLGAILASARWFTHTVATRFRAIFDDVYRRLAAETGSREVDFARFYAALQPHQTSQGRVASPTVAEVRAELQRRWVDVLALPANARRVDRRGSELLPRVREAFAAPGPGWPSARHHSPDLMIAAAGPEALARGDFVVVLGEVHIGLNSVTQPVLAKAHPDPGRLHAARRTEAGRGIAFVEPRATANRASFRSFGDEDLEIEVGDSRSRLPRAQVLAIANLVVTDAAGWLQVRTRDGSQAFDLVEVLEGDLSAESYSLDVLPPMAHRPRVCVDDFVLVRERWQHPCQELGFAKLAAPLDRFLGMRRWASERGIPRFSFVKAAGEPKPFYLDLECPIFVEIFCKLVRSSELVTVTEMVPTLDQLWLTDGKGQAYCSELRMVIVDDIPWSPECGPRPH